MGLENQSTGVMICADRGLRIDWPTIQLDLANTVQKKLTDFQKEYTFGQPTILKLGRKFARLKP